MLEIKQAIDALEKASEWDLLVADLRDYRELAQNLLNAVGTPEQKSKLEKVLAQGDAAIQSNSIDDLRKAVEDLRHMYWAVSFAQDEFWKSQFDRLSDEPEYVDPLGAQRLIEEGSRAVKRSDIASLRTIVWELHGLLPSSQQGTLDRRFANAGLKPAQGK